MKRLFNKILIFFIFVILLLTCVGCKGSSSGRNVRVYSPLPCQISSDKMEYEYGEEIEIEILFARYVEGRYEKDGNTYCVKIYESPCYEIVGDSELYTDGSDITEPIKGEKESFWYRVVFKIKVNEPFEGTACPEYAIKCVDDDYLKSEILHYATVGLEDEHVGIFNTEDPEFPYLLSRVKTGYGFIADADGIKFHREYASLLYRR